MGAMEVGPADAFNAGFGWIKDWSIEAADDLLNNIGSKGCKRVGNPERMKNAIRHAYWSAMMTLNFGLEGSSGVQFYHEYFGSDGYYDTMVDFHNNDVGNQIALALLGGQETMRDSMGFFDWMASQIPGSGMWNDLDKIIRSMIFDQFCDGNLSTTWDASDITALSPDAQEWMDQFELLTGLNPGNNMKSNW